MISVKRKFTFQSETQKRRAATKVAQEATGPQDGQIGRIPRIAKLVALASRMQSMIDSGQVDSFQRLAELGSISQPRMTQIMVH